MLLKQLEYFIKIVDCHSFTEAAEECYISQSAISQQMKSLEDELGVTLLKREKRSFTVTPAGDYFYRQSKIILKNIEKMKKKTIDIGSYDDEHLSFGYLNGFETKKIRRAMAKFTQTYPDVLLDITSGTHEELYNGLESRRIDLAINDQRRAFSPLYANNLLVDKLCYAALSMRNEHAHDEYVNIEDLETIPCILVASKDQEEHEKEFYANTFGVGDNIVFARDNDEALTMVAGNRGYMLLEDKINDDPTIETIPLHRHGEQVVRRYCIFWKKDNENYYTEEFFKMLEDEF